MPFAQMQIQQQWDDLNGAPASGFVLKAYEPGDVNSPIPIFTSDTGSSPQATIILNAAGKYEVSGNEILPYIDRTHMWAIFRNKGDAAANANPFAGFYDNVPLEGASVTYNQGDTGAIDRTLISRLQDYVSVKDFGALGDDVNDQTAIQAAFNSGAEEVNFPEGNYRQGEIVIPTTVKRISGPGIIKQLDTSGSKIFTGTSIDGLTLDGLNILGAFSAGQTTASSDNQGIELTTCTNLKIINCNISNIQATAILLHGCTNFDVSHNMINLVASAFATEGGTNGEIAHNTVTNSIRVDGDFVVAMQCASTDGHAFGNCSNINYIANKISGFKNAQGILMHSGSNCNINDNIIIDPVNPIALSPFNTVDLMEKVGIIGNRVECVTTLAGYSGGNAGISCQGGPASGGGNTLDPTDVNIGENTVINANRATSSPNNSGAIQVGFTKRLAVSDNILTAPGANGVVLADSEENFILSGNIIDGIIVRNNEQNGILFKQPGSIGFIYGNTFNGLNDAAGIGINVDEITASDILIGTNFYNDVTLHGTGFQNTASDSILTVTSGTTVNLSGYKGVLFTHAAPTTITGFTGIVVGNLYTLSSTNGNTTINRDNAVLNGGTNKTLTAGDVMQIRGETATTIAQAAVESINS